MRQGVKNRIVPKWEDYKLNTTGVSYKESGDIEKYLADIFNFNNIVITDEVNPGLPILSVFVESSEDNGKTWTDISKESSITIVRKGQKVSATISDKTYFTKRLRLRIVCGCPGNFKTEEGLPKDTNIGKATIQYKTYDKVGQTYELDSPKLLKDNLCDIIIKKIGLKAGESATFRVVKKDDETVRFNVLLTGNGSDPVTATISNLVPGEYIVTEMDWSWAYEPEGDTENTKNITKGGGNDFTFSNKEKEKAPLHSEAVKNNSIVGSER